MTLSEGATKRGKKGRGRPIVSYSREENARSLGNRKMLKVERDSTRKTTRGGGGGITSPGHHGGGAKGIIGTPEGRQGQEIPEGYITELGGRNRFGHGGEKRMRGGEVEEMKAVAGDWNKGWVRIHTLRRYRLI